ncbi:LacI family DNA-binding transcriptional regulator [Variovorax sp. PCZ-1]|uniref:LacI family DNA-binding transcriptional regulator n=1 Tax=Variovorax sp. PCZ-1 TaxID=2835533 RepID=UPI001BD0A56B|nr:LacI family DNA-binding transcriptional regulator [Variovorax sp. PCZ-1]MBS7807905.1 LacI family DNA-binding transcriptional regulator [Variovorax sp. PCZ-1]
MVKAATSIDVAKLAGVSQSAVSRTYTPGASVAETTRSKVMDAARKLGYRPNAIARTLITRKSRMIAVVASYLDNQFYPVVIEKLSKRLQDDGYHVLLFIAEAHQEADELLMQLMQYHVDGIVLLSATLSSGLAKDCADAGIPVILFNRIAQAGGTVNSVASDNEAGGRMAAQALLAAGHKRIGYIAGMEDSSTNRDREAGFNAELAAAGHRVFARTVGHYSFEGAQIAARQMFQSKDAKQRPSAVFVANDHMAIAVMDTLRSELQLRVPQDVAVIGFDNVPQAAWGGYSLSSIEQDAQAMIEATARIMLEQIQDDTAQAQHVYLPVRLIERGSTAHVLGKSA